METLTSTDTWTKTCPPRLAPPELAAAVADQIRGNLHKWYQGSWFGEIPDSPLLAVTVLEAELRDLSCATTACVAGWAVALGAPVGTMFASRPMQGLTDRVVDEYLILPGSAATTTIPDMAAVLLGLTPRPLGSGTNWLFRAERELDEVLAALDKIARGKPTTVMAEM